MKTITVRYQEFGSGEDTILPSRLVNSDAYRMCFTISNIINTIQLQPEPNFKDNSYFLQLSEDLQIDYESYEWKKLDPDSDETKKLVKEYFVWEGDFGGKRFNQGKIFK